MPLFKMLVLIGCVRVVVISLRTLVTITYSEKQFEYNWKAINGIIQNSNRFWEGNDKLKILYIVKLRIMICFIFLIQFLYGIMAFYDISFSLSILKDLALFHLCVFSLLTARSHTNVQKKKKLTFCLKSWLKPPDFLYISSYNIYNF